VARVEQDEERDERITMEIIVDAYSSEEQALGWYYYLDKKLHFPFKARCIEQKRISPLKKGEVVEVIGMPPEADCESDMFVEIRWMGRTMGVPLSQLEAVVSESENEDGDEEEERLEAIADWHYWVGRGRTF
jgi:hypothetical protein